MFSTLSLLIWVLAFGDASKHHDQTGSDVVVSKAYVTGRQSRKQCHHGMAKLTNSALQSIDTTLESVWVKRLKVDRSKLPPGMTVLIKKKSTCCAVASDQKAHCDRRICNLHAPVLCKSF